MKTEPYAPSLLPYSLDLERNVLNAALEWGRLPPGLTHDLFFRDANAIAWRAVQHAASQGLTPLEPVVRHILTERGQIEDVGSIYLNDLAKEGVRPTDAGLRSIVQQLEDLGRKRRVAQLVIRHSQDPANVDLDQLAKDVNALRIAGSVGIKSSFRTARELADAAERVEWIVRGYLAKGAITELTGKAKVAGKTTLFAHIVACILDGDHCLGDMARRGPVVYLTEQTHSTFREVLRRSALLERDDISILSKWDVKGVPWPEIAQMAGEKADQIGADVVIVDTLPQFAGIKGDAENNSGDAYEALEPLQALAHRGKAILLSRHGRKGGGDVGEDGRGSTAFTAGVDIVLSLKRPEGNHSQRPTARVIESLSRFDETPARLVIEKYSIPARCPSSGIEVWADAYRVIGDSEAAATDAAKSALILTLPTTEDTAIGITDLVESTGATRQTVQRALKLLPNLRTRKDGKRLLYFCQEMVAAQTSNPEGHVGQNAAMEVNL